MIKSPQKILFVCAALFGMSSCVSVEKYNQRREKPISVKKLQNDIDFVQNTLYKRHPDFDYYTPKAVLDKQFDSLRASITQPLTMNAFYVQLSKVVSNVRQGHMVLLPAPIKAKKERKKYLKSMGASPLTQFDYLWENEKLLVHRQRTTDTSIKPGWELIAINDIPVKDLYKKYEGTYSSDGYNQTAMPMFFARRVPVFYSEELGQLDSARFLFKDGNQQIEKMIARQAKEKSKDKKSNKDTIDHKIAKQVVDSLKANDTLAVTDTISKNAVVTKTEEEIKKEKEAKKAEEDRKDIYGYDKVRKEYIRSLKFYEDDSAIAYFKIRQFADGPYKKSYQEIFDSVKNVGSDVLVLDLRDNPGGRAAEIVELYRYFTDSSFLMYAPIKVSSKTSLLSPGFYSVVPKLLWPFLSLYYPVYAVNRFVKTKKYDDGNYYFHGLSGIKWKENHEKAFKGKVYVLINGGSFSAACLLASKMSLLPNVTIVGEETGGDFNGTVAGQLPMVTLPNSNIIWRLGLMHIRPSNRTDVKGRGIFPDVEMHEKAADLIQNKDVIMDWILEKESKKAS